MFPRVVESGSHIDINVSKIHSDNCGKSTAHAQNIILILIGLGFFGIFSWRGGGHPSLFCLRC